MWMMIVWWLASIAVQVMLEKKPSVTNAKAASANDANFSTASSKDTIPVIWGKGRLRKNNVAWYGDYQAVPMVKEFEVGGFLGFGSKTVRQTTGFKYYWGQQLALCHGEVTLHRIWADERLLWTGTSTGGDIPIDLPGLYGGDEQGGGIQAVLRFSSGSMSQGVDPYLQSQLGSILPAWRGVSHLVWVGPSGPGIPYTKTSYIFLPPAHGDVQWIKHVYTQTLYHTSGYVGTSPNPEPLNFELSRYPDLLHDGMHKIGDDSNMAHAIYEIYTNDPNGEDGWGMGFPADMMDLPSFLACSQKLYAEGFGLSIIWSEAIDLEDLVAEICKVIDAECYRDFKTGKVTMKLIRKDYVESALPVLGVDNILDFSNFELGTLDGKTNEVVVNYTSRARDYVSLPSRVQDTASMRSQNAVKTETEDIPWIMDGTLADRVANRDLLSASVPVAKAEVIVNRENYSYGVGDPFKIVWPDLGIASMIMRIKSVAIGMPTGAKIRMTLIQDVFNLSATAYTDEPPILWVEPVPVPTPVVVHFILEAPYFLNTNTAYASYVYCAKQPNDGCRSLEVFDKKSTDSEVTSRGQFLSFCPVGILSSAYPAMYSVDNSGTLILTGTGLSSLGSATEDEMRGGRHLFVFETGEICSFAETLNNLDGTFTLQGIWRGLLDTVPTDHAAGEKIYFFASGGAFPGALFGETETANIYSIASGPKGVAAASATISKTFTNRNGKPYPPGQVLANNFSHMSPIGGALQVYTWEHRNRLADLLRIYRQDELGGATPEGTYFWRLLIGGGVYHSAGPVGYKTWTYTAAQRMQDSTDGKALVKFQIWQATGSGSSAINSTGAYQMAGFGMYFGQLF